MSKGSIRQRGDKWYYSFEAASVNGKRKRIEEVGGLTEDEARDSLRKAIDEYENGGMPVKISDMSFADYLDYWMHNYVEVNLKYNTVKNYRNIINNYIKPYLGKYHLQSLSPAVLQRMINTIKDAPAKRTGKPLAKHSVEIILTVLTEALKMAVYPYQVLKENPASYVTMPKYPPVRRDKTQDLKIISLDQFHTILAAYPPSSPFHMPLVIAFYTGMRRGEVAGLTWDCVDLQNGIITVEKQMIQKGRGIFDLDTPKSAAGFREVPISSELVDELRRQRTRQSENRLRYADFYNESNFVCTHANGKPVTTGSIKYYARQVPEKLHIPFTFHSLRHTHATMLMEAGVEAKVVQQRLGHSKISTTLDTYTHVTTKTQLAAISDFDKYLHGQNKKPNEFGRQW